MRVSDQPVYILHSRPYRESSLLIDALSRDYGQIGLIARGVRKERSRWRGILQPMQPLLVGWSGRSELVNLTAAEPAAVSLPALLGERLFAGMYLNELVVRLGRHGDGQGVGFDTYQLCLQRLAGGEPLAWTLRRFERDFLCELGYALQLVKRIDADTELSADMEYGYDVEAGPFAAERIADGGLRLRGSSLLALEADVMPDEAGLQDLRRLMRVVIRHHLGGGLLNAWQLHLR